MSSEVFQSSLQTVIGRIIISADHHFITKLEFDDKIVIDQNVEIPDHLTESLLQVAAYFDHPEIQFSLPLQPASTCFQSEIRTALSTIPCGETATYEALASKVNKQGASRAVGMALSRNPLLIIVPCHRVIGSNGALTGFAGGLHRKRWLLTHERRNPLFAGF